MSEDIAVVAALLQAEGLIEPVEKGEVGGFRVTAAGYKKGHEMWMKMSGEDRLLIALFLRKSTLI